jgi:hypothetical protein
MPRTSTFPSPPPSTPICVSRAGSPGFIPPTTRPSRPPRSPPAAATASSTAAAALGMCEGWFLFSFFSFLFWGSLSICVCPFLSVPINLPGSSFLLPFLVFSYRSHSRCFARVHERRHLQEVRRRPPANPRARPSPFRWAVGSTISDTRTRMEWCVVCLTVSNPYIVVF